MADALVGHTGFVGSNLRTARAFEHLFHSRNLADMAGRSFDEVWFCGLPATKWAVNQNEASDLANMRSIQDVLATVKCDRFVLISTIDVYNDHEPYGRNRRAFEDFVAEQFAGRCTVRLPGLFGPGLKKNVLFDLLTKNMLDRIHSQDAYQWYDVADIVADVERVRSHGVTEADLFTEPVVNARILSLFEGLQITDPDRAPRQYDYRSAEAELFDGEHYIRSADVMLERMRAFVGDWQRGHASALS